MKEWKAVEECKGIKPKAGEWENELETHLYSTELPIKSIPLYRKLQFTGHTVSLLSWVGLRRQGERGLQYTGF